MSYQSVAQRGYFHAHAGKDIPNSVVKEFDKASKGQKNLPYHKRPKNSAAATYKGLTQ